MGLPEQVGGPSNIGREALAVTRVAGTFLQQARHPLTAHFTQPLAANGGSEPPRHSQLIAIVTAQLILEVRSNLEQLGKLRIVLLQQIVVDPFPDQYDLEIDRNGARLQGHGTHQADVVGQ